MKEREKERNNERKRERKKELKDWDTGETNKGERGKERDEKRGRERGREGVIVSVFRFRKGVPMVPFSMTCIKLFFIWSQRR